MGDLGIVKAIQKAYNLAETTGRQTDAQDRRAVASVPLGGVVVSVGQSGEQDVMKRKLAVALLVADPAVGWR